jgi:hypothetical protein
MVYLQFAIKRAQKLRAISRRCARRRYAQGRAPRCARLAPLRKDARAGLTRNAAGLLLALAWKIAAAGIIVCGAYPESPHGRPPNKRLGRFDRDAPPPSGCSTVKLQSCASRTATRPSAWRLRSPRGRASSGPPFPLPPERAMSRSAPPSAGKPGARLARRGRRSRRRYRRADPRPPFSLQPRLSGGP